MKPVGVLGASGYAGRELCMLINQHPRMQLAFATANEQRGTSTRIAGREVAFIGTEEALLDSAELIFSALPHGASREWSERARDAGARVVDLSHDLRPGNGCEGVPYGITELARDRIVDATVVANPGCYPTSVLLSLAPFISAGLIPGGTAIQINSASGVSGAGNSPKRELLFAEVASDYRAYGIGNGHRHLNEMRQTMRDWGADVDLIFTPHLLPVSRGILSTITFETTDAAIDPLAVLRDAYADEKCIEVTAESPALRDVVHRNVARIHASRLGGTRRPTVLVLCAIDNLMKGAAGQAVQNANLMLGLDETEGLPL